MYCRRAILASTGNIIQYDDALTIFLPHTEVKIKEQKRSKVISLSLDGQLTTRRDRQCLLQIQGIVKILPGLAVRARITQ